MKIALIQDQLLTPAGSERVFLYMVEEEEEECTIRVSRDVKSLPGPVYR